MPEGVPDNPKVFQLFECSLGESELVRGQMPSWRADRRQTSVDTMLDPMI